MTSPLRRSRFSEGDGDSTAIVEDLLGSLNEWRSVPDIVRLSLKALSDVVKVQGATLRELDRQVNTKLSKTEFSSAISQKASSAEFAKTLTELTSSLQDKVGLVDMQTLLDDKVTRSELQYMVSSKVSVDEMRRALDLKANSRELEAELRAVQKQFSEFVGDFNKRSANFVHHSELLTIQRALDSKANEAADILSSFKSQLAEGLARKANVADFDKLSAGKADIVSQSELRQEYETIRVSLEQLQHLEHEVASKVDKAELLRIVGSQLATLASKSEVDALHTNQLNARRQTELRLKEQFVELETYLASLKSEFETLHNEFTAKLGAKADLQALGDLIKKAEFVNLEAARQTQDIRREIDKVLDRSQSLVESEASRRIEETEQLHSEVMGLRETTRADLDDIRKLLQANRSDKAEEFKLRSELDRLYSSLGELKQTSVEDLGVTKSSLSKLVETEVADLRNSFSSLQRDLYRQHQVLQEECKTRVSQCEVAMSYVSKAEDMEELHRAIRQENRDLKHFMDSKVGDFNNKNSLVEHKLLDLAALVDRLQADSVQRHNFTELARVIENKADTADIKYALRELSENLELKAPASELRTYVQDQEIINEALCGENCLGRWIWKSGGLRSSQVPWEQQSVNTCPDNFLWDKDSTSIVALAPGLYEVMFGFYARRRPTIQLLVNGEPVLQRTGKTAKPGSRVPSSTVSGVTHIDFLALPARASVTVSYGGDASGEGFLCLRKL
jgi:hypothetical protein